MSTITITETLTKAHSQILSRLPKDSPLSRPRLAIVCGSGLGGLGDRLEERVEIDLKDLEGGKSATVPGHLARLAFGYLSSEESKSRVPVVCQLGRYHAYEGHALRDCIFPIRLFKTLGCDTVIVTNAAGGLDASKLKVADVVVLRDHLSLPSLTSWNPLIGRNEEDLGPRFPAMSDAYDFTLRKMAFHAARDIGLPKGTLKEGTYAWVAGPTYETKAECKFLLNAGADVVGMSTVPEVIAARHAGLQVLALSLVTNIVIQTPYRSAEAEADQEYEEHVAGEKKPPIPGSAAEGQAPGGVRSVVMKPYEKELVANHQEVLEVSANRAKDMRELVGRIVEMISNETPSK